MNNEQKQMCTHSLRDKNHLRATKLDKWRQTLHSWRRPQILSEELKVSHGDVLGRAGACGGVQARVALEPLSCRKKFVSLPLSVTL